MTVSTDEESRMNASVPSQEGEEEDADPPSTTELLRELLRVQQQRAHIYSRMKHGFEELLGGGDELAYQTAMQAITLEFNECSKLVRRIDAAFQQQAGDGDAADVAPHPLSVQIRILQEHEKTKLQMTATLQVLRKAHTAGAWEWQRGPAGLPPPPPPSSEDADAPPANAQSWRRCACEAPDCTQQPPDPTEEEYTSAVEEATKKLEAAVQGVNEVLEELRYEMEEE